MDDPVLSRRSIRKYTGEPVDDATVERLLRAAMAAPSAGNQQPWQFVVIRDRATLTAITDVHPYSKMLPDAPLAVVVCGDAGACKWPQMWEQDCAAATENLLIEAELLGLGAVWLGVHPLEERVAGIRRLLCVPDSVVPFAVVPVGHSAESKPPSDRYDEARVHYERW
jgi:nitroreductase